MVASSQATSSPSRQILAVLPAERSVIALSPLVVQLDDNDPHCTVVHERYRGWWSTQALISWHCRRHWRVATSSSVSSDVAERGSCTSAAALRSIEWWSSRCWLRGCLVRPS